MPDIPSRPPMMPADTPDYMAPAWVSFIMWAVETPEILEQFRKETGNAWKPGRRQIERIVNDACGEHSKLGREFVEWANARLWSPRLWEQMDG